MEAEFDHGSALTLQLGRLLAEQRARAGLTQEEAAERAGLSVRALRNIEHGLVAQPRRHTIAALVAALNVEEPDQALIDRYVRMARTVDGPLPTVPGDRPQTSGSLPPAPACYVGRDEAVKELERRLTRTSADQPTSVFVVGAPGTGKTALVLHVAHRVQDEFPDGQIFLGLGRDPDPTGVLARALRLLGVSNGEVPTNVDEQLERYRSILAGRRQLIIADDATAAQARLLLPGACRSALMVTSRSVLPSLDGFARITLAPLTPGEGIDLLARLLGPERVAAEKEAAARIVAFCDGLPLALRVAGGRLATHSYRSLTWLAQRLAVGHRRLDELTVDDVGVRASLLSACSGLSRPARRLLGRLGQLDLVQVATWVCAAIMDNTPDDVADPIDELVAMHLVEPVDTPAAMSQRFALHDLVHTFAGELGLQDEPAEELAAARRRVFGAALLRAEEAREVANSSLIIPETPDVPRWGDSAIAEIAAVGADRWFRGEQHSLVALTLQACDLGELDYAYGLAAAMYDFHDAMRLDEEMQLIHERIFDAAAMAGHEVAQAYAAFGRAELNANRGQQHKIMSDLQFALGIFHRYRSRLPMATLNTEVVLAHTLRIQGEAASALALARTIVEVAIQSGNTRAEASTRQTLGTCLSWSGDHHNALAAFQRSLKLFEQVGSAMGVSLCLMRIGTELGMLGLHDEAEHELEHSLRLSLANGNPQGEPFILLALADNAIIARRSAAARRYLQRCAVAVERHPGEILTARMLLGHGRIFEREGAYDQALQYYRRAFHKAANVGAFGLVEIIGEHLSALVSRCGQGSCSSGR
jgi:transcriptional regulator with XRE-family HTH domain/tetratricopeptide (TPR) repeat protein